MKHLCHDSIHLGFFDAVQILPSLITFAHVRMPYVLLAFSLMNFSSSLRICFCLNPSIQSSSLAPIAFHICFCPWHLHPVSFSNLPLLYGKGLCFSKFCIPQLSGWQILHAQFMLVGTGKNGMNKWKMKRWLGFNNSFKWVECKRIWLILFWQANALKNCKNILFNEVLCLFCTLFYNCKCSCILVR